MLRRFLVQQVHVNPSNIHVTNAFRPCFSTCQTSPYWPNVATLMLQLCTRMQHQCCDIEQVEKLGLSAS
jgi:hypothetical protein